jgi:hypothetical protein
VAGEARALQKQESKAEQERRLGPFTSVIHAAPCQELVNSPDLDGKKKSRKGSAVLRRDVPGDR